jgi:hypothetical protein
LHQVSPQLRLRATGDNSDTSHTSNASSIVLVSRSRPTSMPILPTGHISLPLSAPMSHLRSPTRCWSANIKECNDKLVPLVTSATSTDGSHFEEIRPLGYGRHSLLCRQQRGPGTAHRHAPGALGASTQLVAIVQSTIRLNASIAPRMSKGPS